MRAVTTGWALLATWTLGALMASSCVLDRTAGIIGEGGNGSGQGGQGLGGFTSETPCEDASDCGNDSACATVACVEGMCVVNFLDPGDPCMGNSPEVDTCNGMGTCVECALPGDCVTGECSMGMQTGGEACEQGACIELPGTMACDPYVCDPTGVTCLVNCADSADCMAGFFCDTTTSTCEMPVVDGDPCTVNEGCQSGFCADGVCCNEACQGECRSCVNASTGFLDGVCGPILPGADPDMECIAGFGCEGDSTCVECGEAPLPTGSVAACPMQCDDCTNGVCLIDCDVADECRDGVITCPPGYDCNIQCTGNDSCRNSAINCPPAGACNLTCESNNHKCEDSTITCGDGPCTVDCQGGDTCDAATVVCGANSCDVTCSNTNTPVINGGNLSCNPTSSNCL